MATPSEEATGPTDQPVWDLASGAALGLLLGMLVGLAATAIVSTVVSALIALLAGLFGLGGQVGVAITAGAGRRLAAFALAAALTVPGATWMRTHDVLGPTLAEQKQALRDIGYMDGSPEHTSLMRYLRYGIALPNAPATPNLSRGVLYSDAPGGFCDEISRVDNTEDLVAISKRYGAATEEAMRRVAALPDAAKPYAVKYTRIFLCSGAPR